MKTLPLSLPTWALICGGVVLCTACSGKPEVAPPATGASAPAAGSATTNAPAVSITTVRAAKRDLPVLLTATGTVTPLSSVDVRPQVTSVVSQVHVREGQMVRAGELLFTLDSRIDEANVAKAQAQLARDEASLADARRQLARSKELFAQNFISQGAVDTNQTAVEAQTALVASDRAALEAARVTLSYAKVKAPGAGRVGASNVFAGSAVQANQTSLITLTQLDPIAVAFSLPQRHLAAVLDALKDGGAAVTASLPESKERFSGRLKFVDSVVDASSGTVKAKALFSNTGSKLWPGAFVNVAMTARTLKDVVVIPQASIVQTQRGTIVYAVQDGKAALRPVQLLYAQGDDAAVTGVNAGERIVLDGRQNLRPGVAVVERSGDTAGKPAARASGAASAAAPQQRASAP